MAAPHVKALMLACALALTASAAFAQLRIGQTVGVTGAVAATVKESMQGAQLYLDHVNAKGGVGGEKIEVITLDDAFDVKKAEANARTLIEERGVLALFMSRGTPHTEAINTVLEQHRVALIGPSTGAMVLHQPVKPYIFNVRATYQREAERAVRHLSLIGMERIAVLQVDDSFGADAVQGAQKGFAAVGKKPALLEKFDRAKPDFSAIAPKVAKAEAQAVLFIGSGVAVADGIKALRGAGSRAQVVTLSNNASAGFIKQLGEQARGTIVTQVFPYERSLSAPIIREAADLLRAKGSGDISPAMMEGFAAAKVLVEGLKRAGNNPTREKLIAALNGLRKLDLGGMELGYSGSDHSGLDYADLSIIGPDGKFHR